MASQNTGPRARDIGISIGVLPPGPLNSLTDVPGVKVGHVSLIKGEGKLLLGKVFATVQVPVGCGLFIWRRW